MKIEKPTPACPEEEAYLKYIDEHRNYVYTAFLRFGQKICLALSLVQGEYDQLRRNVYYHDASKYGLEEFAGYRQWFYPKAGEEKDAVAFKKAWHHHYGINLHHWNHYVSDGKADKMPKLQIAEMILDWIAMSMKQKNTPNTWYQTNKDSIILHKETRKQVETVLDILSTETEYPFRLYKPRRHPKRK